MRRVWSIVASTTGDGRGTIQLVRVRKTFGDVVAVDDLDLTIGDGEFFDSSDRQDRARPPSCG